MGNGNVRVLPYTRTKRLRELALSTLTLCSGQLVLHNLLVQSCLGSTSWCVRARASLFYVPPSWSHLWMRGCRWTVPNMYTMAPTTQAAFAHCRRAVRFPAPISLGFTRESRESQSALLRLFMAVCLLVHAALPLSPLSTRAVSLKSSNLRWTSTARRS